MGSEIGAGSWAILGGYMLIFCGCVTEFSCREQDPERHGTLESGEEDPSINLI